MKHLLPAALIALFIQTATAQTSNGVPLQGVVTQRGSDEVVWGASVELRKEGGTTALYGALTGVDGKFAFPSVAPHCDAINRGIDEPWHFELAWKLYDTRPLLHFFRYGCGLLS